jgi:hypothetical protein
LVSTVHEVLEQLKYNMDLCCIKTFALFRICNKNIIRRLELDENIQTAQAPIEDETEIRILFRSWICDEEGKFERSALQDGIRDKQPNTALWLKYIEATFMVASGKYLLTEDEALMLGCLKLQVSLSLCLCLSETMSRHRPILETTITLFTLWRCSKQESVNRSLLLSGRR